MYQQNIFLYLFPHANSVSPCHPKNTFKQPSHHKIEKFDLDILWHTWLNMVIMTI